MTQILTSPGALFASLPDPDARLFVQLLGRPDGRDMLYRISGKVLNHVRGNAYGDAFPHGATLFGVEGFNIRRLAADPGTGDLHLLSREIVFYTDPKTGTPLTSWTNPLDGRTRPLPPIANDHVDSRYRVRDGVLYGLFGPAQVPLGDSVTPARLHDSLVWTVDAPPLYSLAERYRIDDDFGLANRTYAAWELFDFLVDRREAEARATVGGAIPHGAMRIVNCWTRACPYIPAMAIAEAEAHGNLVYHARSWTLDAFTDLEPWLRDAVNERFPLYAAAPDAPSAAPNDTTWTAFHARELAPRGISWRAWCAESAC
ncbi:DUF1838 family protein [Yinghuangia seranimata]|uniref:DUF1838 family protein n=1 Tax=Yinghuangia seranimata TaxID=408067 RepID=UPI00248C9F54|nr:DUF1838 family protein [Yinghuangia seranimata]MDI2132456.1 DUF1838 family protein [Yinghuangia seranimata]